MLVSDEVPWGGAFNPALTALSVDDLDHVEVLRGPAPVMYGATSFVGVLHVVHRPAGDRTREASASFGSYGSGRGTLGTGLPEWGGFSSRLAVDAAHQGFKDDRTGYDRAHVSWRNARVLGSGHFGFDVDVHGVNQDPASPHVREGRVLSTRTPLDANYNPDGAFLDDRRFTGTARYTRPAGSATWSSVASFGHYSHGIFRGFLDDLDTSGANARAIRGNVDGNDLYFDSHVAWPAAAQWKLVAGVDHLHGEGKAKGGAFDYRADLAGVTGTTGLETAVPDDDQVEDRREFSGAYGFVEYAPTPNLRLEAGLRLNRTLEEREDPREKGMKPEGAEDPGKRTDNKVSGTAGLTWTAWSRNTSSLRLFADYRHAFKPAAFDFGIGEGEDPDKEGLLDPETADTYEAGVRVHALADGALELEVSGFLMDFQNLVISTAVNGVPALTNGGDERFKGIEAEAEWRAYSHLRLRGAYAFHDAKFTDSVQLFDGVPTQLAGKRLEMSARRVAGGSIVWAPERGLVVSADVHHVGSRFLNKRNTALSPAYTELSAGAGWRFARWELRADGRNLTDERAPVSESELGDAQYYRLPARRLEVTARVRF
jgi:iron complex outermembrane receptor protein